MVSRSREKVQRSTRMCRFVASVTSGEEFEARALDAQVAMTMISSAIAVPGAFCELSAPYRRRAVADVRFSYALVWRQRILLQRPAGLGGSATDSFVIDCFCKDHVLRQWIATPGRDRLSGTPTFQLTRFRRRGVCVRLERMAVYRTAFV